jgi:hypothetical protein
VDSLIAGILAAALALAVILGVVWPRTAFLIEIADGEARLRKGKISHRLVEELSSIVSENGIARGEIRGISQVGRSSIRFSREIPESFRQRFRNLFYYFRELLRGATKFRSAGRSYEPPPRAPGMARRVPDMARLQRACWVEHAGSSGEEEEAACCGRCGGGSAGGRSLPQKRISARHPRPAWVAGPCPR